MSYLIPYALAFFAIGMITLYSFTLTEAQVEVEDFTEEDKTKKFRWLQFEFYYRASNIGDGDALLSDIEEQRVNHVLKRIPVPVKTILYCDHEVHGEIYMSYGAYVFKNQQSANTVKEWMKDNIPFRAIDYAVFELTENNHHWDKPTPDEVIEKRIFGNEEQFETVSSECFNS